MGMIVNVFRDGQDSKFDTDSTNGGLSSKFDRIFIENIEGPFNEGDRGTHRMPFGLHRARLERGPFAGTVHIVYNLDKANGDVTTFGGNFAYTSDSRFHRAVEEITGNKHSFGPVPIHDRVEY
jgi:hypothetical protein